MASNFRDQFLQQIDGGMATAMPPSNIADNQAVDMLNVEYRFDNMPSSRLGTTRLSEVGMVSDRWTSIFSFFQDDGSQFVLATAGTKIFKRVVSTFQIDTGLNDSDITGTLNLPNDTYWQWVTFDNKAIGVNGGSSLYDNPVQFDGSIPATLLDVSGGGTAIPAKYIAAINLRVFLAGDPADRSNLQWCKMLDSTTWAAGSLANDPGSVVIGPGDGDYITGLLGVRDRLFIFKQHHIYELVFGDPNTDQTLFSVKLVAARVGCTSGYSIQIVNNDVVFMSEFGLANLEAVLQGGVQFSVDQALSKNILEFRTGVDRSVDTYGSAVLSDTNQYFLSVPVNSDSPFVNNMTFVMDFKRGVSPDTVRWTRMDNRMLASVFGIVPEHGRSRLYVGDNTENTIQRFGDDDNFADNDDSVLDVTPEAYDKEILTKEYNLGTGLKRKLFNYFGFEWDIPSAELIISVTYKPDGNIDMSETYQESYLIPSPSLYGSAQWDIDHFTDPIGSDRDFLRRFSGVRRAETMQFLVSVPSIDEGFTVKEFWLSAQPLGKKFVDDSTH